MGEIVNLRRARKGKRRAEDEKRADENRIAFGTPKALKSALATERDRAARRLDAARLDRKPPADDDA